MVACLAADLTWLAYGHGLLLAADRSPSSLVIDVRAFGATLYAWAVADYPAIAIAVGAALQLPGGGSLPLEAIATTIQELLKPHIGGGAAPDETRDVLRDFSLEEARVISALLASGKTPTVTGPAVSAGLLARVRTTFGTLFEVEERDAVLEFERASAPLVFEAIAGERGLTEIERTLADLMAGIQAG